MRAEVRHAGQSHRLLALAAIYDGASRDATALLAGTDHQSIRDWVVRSMRMARMALWIVMAGDRKTA